MKRLLLYTAAATLAWTPMAAAQEATTDVDAETSAQEQSPLAPEQAQAPAPLTLDDLIAGAGTYTPPPAAAPAAAPQAEPVRRLPPAAYAPTPTDSIYAAPVAAPSVTPPAPAAPQPIYVDDRGATPDAPPTAVDIAYESRVLGVFRATQGRQGPLDGRWRVTANGLDVYILQFADPGAGESRVEGAWRNVRREGSLDASGFVEQVSREADEVVVRFTDAARRSAELRLRPSSDGGWRGRVVWPEGGTDVVMTRDVSVEALASGAQAYTPPPPTQPARAEPAPSRSRATATNNRRPAARSRASARRR